MNETLYYDRGVAMASMVTTVLLIPVNCLLIFVLLRRHNLYRPFNWLFLNMAIFDNIYLVAKSAWYYEQDLAGGQPHDCSSLDFALRLLERSTEMVSSWSTVAIAVIRAVGVYESTRNREMKIETKHIVLALCLVWLSGIVVVIESYTVDFCRALSKCANGLIPMSGILEFIHDAVIVFLIIGLVNICYGYICFVLVKHRCILNSAHIQVDRHTHRRTIVILLVYVVLFTLLVGPAHAYALVLKGGCPADSDSDNNVVENDVFEVFMGLLPLGACGFNAALLYMLSGAIRQSVGVIMGQFRGCVSVVRLNEEEV